MSRIGNYLRETRKDDRFVRDLEEALRPRKDGDGTAFGFNWATLMIVIFAGVVMAGVVLPLYFGNPDPSFVEGLYVPVSS